MIFRGGVYWVDLDPTVGSELRKTRPCVVVQRDAATNNSPTTTVCPITDANDSTGNLLNILVPHGTAGLKKASLVVCNQIRALDKSRISDQIGTLSPEVMDAVDRGLKAILDLR